MFLEKPIKVSTKRWQAIAYTENGLAQLTSCANTQRFSYKTEVVENAL